MKKIRRILEAKWLVMLVWLAGVAVVWEIFAFRVEAVKRTPENIMPHIWQIVQAIFSTNTVTRDQTALQPGVLRKRKGEFDHEQLQPHHVPGERQNRSGRQTGGRSPIGLRSG